MLAALASCDRGTHEPGAVRAFDLRQALAGADTLSIQVSDEAVLARVRESVERRSPEGFSIDLALSERTPLGTGRRPAVWIGSAASAGGKELFSGLGVEPRGEGFRFLGEDYSAFGDGLVATISDPRRPGASLAIVLGVDAAAAVDWIDDWTPTWRLGWRSYRGGALEREGVVDASGRAQLAGHVDLEAAERELFAAARTGERDGFTWTAAPGAFLGLDDDAREAWLAQLDLGVDAARQRLAGAGEFESDPQLSLRLFPSLESFQRVLRQRDGASAAALRRLQWRGELCAVRAPGGVDNIGFELARAFAVARAGEPRAAWMLDAVAAASASHWFGVEREVWCAKLMLAPLPSLEQLLAEPCALSPHQSVALRGALLEFLEARDGRDFAARHWRSAPASLALPSDAEFHAALEQRFSEAMARERLSRDDRRAAVRARPWRRGVCLLASPAPASDGPFGSGYASDACPQTLGELRTLGANAISLNWCAAFETSAPLRFGDGPRAYSQSDAAGLLWTTARARALGMTTMWVPQWLTSEHGGWATSVSLTTPRSQRELFERWRARIADLGWLAELAGVDILALGAEAPDASSTKPAPGNKRGPDERESLLAEWRALIACARGSFSGALTYASRWDGETQGIEFWPELDYLAQNVFVPYGRAESDAPPGTGEYVGRLVSTMGHLRQLARERNVGCLVSSIGVTSTRDGWREPWRPLGPADVSVQTNFYESLQRALQSARRQDLLPDGVFAWCWWTDARFIGAADRGFSVQNKLSRPGLARVLQMR